MTDNASKHPAKTVEVPSKAWLCAEKYDQVLLAYLVCAWHIFPLKARKILRAFFSNAVIRVRLTEESNRAGNCFRVISQQALDMFVYDTCGTPEAGIEPLKISVRADATSFFNQAWARFTVSRALRRALFFCQQEKEEFLYQTLIDDLARKPYSERKIKMTLREMYHASERVKVIFRQQVESVLQQTISDPRLVMEEWQQLHQILPDVIALDPEMATQHDLAIQDMTAFWKELLEEKVADTGKSCWDIIHGPQSVSAHLQKARKHIHEQKNTSYIPAELSEAMNYACLAAELLKADPLDTELKLKKRMLSRGFFWLSKQKWLDDKTIELAIQAENKMQQMTVVINEE
jgi:hypothetical protein